MNMIQADIVHATNSVYGRRSHYGARSSYIAGAAPSDKTLQVFCRGVEPQACRPHNVKITRVKLSPWSKIKRALMGRTGPGREKLWASWQWFDALTARKLSRMDRGSLKIFHSWEWMPESYAMVRNRHPDAFIVRDVIIARRKERRSGEDMVDEAERVDRFLSPSAYATKCLCDWGISNSKIIEIPFGVDTNVFRPVQSRSEKPIRFAFTGKASVRKGAQRLLRVWKRLGLREAELHLYGATAPDVREMLPDVAGVHAHGFMDITGELAMNHVFVLPSTLEGSSKAVFEALACGLPVITTPNSGSVVRHGIDGFIVGPEDEEALGESIQTLYQNHRLREKMGASARQRAKAFTWDAYINRVWATYDSLIASPR